MKRIFCFVLLLLLMPVFSISAEDGIDLATDLNSIARYETQGKSWQEHIDTAFCESPADGAEWYILALKSYGKTLDLSAYADALASYVETETVTSAATRKKLALTLLSLGKGECSFVTEVRSEVLDGQGIMSEIFALHLLNGGVSVQGHTKETLLETLVSKVLDDGGWALYGNVSDVDVTAMVLQAIAPYQKDLEDVIDKALLRLSSLQKEDGDFASYGVTNPESTAQVIMALTALGIDPLTDSRFIKDENTLLDGMIKYRMENGAYSHTVEMLENRNATAQAFCALISLSLFEKGQEGIYYLNDVGTIPDLLQPIEREDGIENKTEDAFSQVATWKWIALATVLLLSAILVLFCLIKKKQGSAFLVVLVAALILIFLFVIKLESPDDYFVYEEPQNPVGQVTFSIDCSVVAGKDGLPGDGVILSEALYTIGEGDTVYDLLLRATKANRIPVTTSGTYTKYVEGIDQLYEFRYGSLSGWVYTVNGVIPSVGCDAYSLKDGDVVIFSYTLSLGSG